MSKGSKIRVLPDDIINKIAAGEVIANPASVVKELVENAIDAGSKEIIVEIKAGGRMLIRISDDGCGMNGDDALLCLERHGTSKLRHLDDLQTLETMGFRGEAVPSIASISKMTLITCPAPESDGTAPPEGTMVIVEGGRVLKFCSAVRSPGTTFEVKSLFYNVPVRKKFQKSPAYDSGEILRIVGSLALANPLIKFQLIDDQKEILHTSINTRATLEESISNRIKDVLGNSFLSAMHPLRYKQGDYQLQGVIGIPSYTRQNRSGQYLFINGRAVVSPLISQAIREGYGTALPSQRHPIYVLYLQMPAALVDVNVHPQKREVRLCEEMILKDVIAQGALHALQQVAPDIQEAPPQSFHRPEITPNKFSVIPAFSRDISSHSTHEKVAIETVDWILPAPTEEKEPIVEKKEEIEKKETQLISTQKTSIIHVLATIPGYFFAEKHGEGLCLIDQRRAHHRVLFERFSHQIDQGEQAPRSIQPLLIPHTLELSKPESAAMREWLPTLNTVGIIIREFGETTFLVDAVPESCYKQNVAELLHEIVHDLSEFQTTRSLKQAKEKQLSQLAARAAIRAEVRLSIHEAQVLVDQLMKCLSPQQCPLGKPTIVHIQREAISKLFGL